MRRWLAWPPGCGLACPPGRGLATLRTSSHPSPPFARPSHEMAAKCGRGRASVRRHAAESHHVIRACGHDRGSVLTSPWVTAPCEATAGDSRADGTVSDDGHEYGRAEALQEAPRTMRYPELPVQGSPCTLDRSGEQTGHDGGPEAARRCRPTRALTSRGIERTSVTPAASGCVGDDRVHAGPREAVEDGSCRVGVGLDDQPGTSPSVAERIAARMRFISERSERAGQAHSTMVWDCSRMNCCT